MLLAIDLRPQARVCARLAEDCDNRCLAERLKAMAMGLLDKAGYFEELPSERVTHRDRVVVAKADTTVARGKILKRRLRRPFKLSS